MTDARELYLLVEAEDWAYSAQAPPDWGLAARRFAQLVNVLSRIRNKHSAKPHRDPPQGEVNETLEQLKRLGDLPESGVLTEEEFMEQKARILGDQ